LKIALVHDYLNQFGGAERVVEALTEIFPQSPIYTSIYDENKMPPAFKKEIIEVSYLQKMPFILGFFKLYLFMYPTVFQKMDLSGFEVVLSSSSAFAKGVSKPQGSMHICYCHNPARFLWQFDDYMEREKVPHFFKAGLNFLLEDMRQWDLKNSERVDHFIANSKAVADRIKKIYGRESAIINPPVEARMFRPSPVDQDYYLVVSRLNSYKKIDIVVEAFNQLGLDLIIIGEGPDKSRLEALAKDNIRFLGRLNDQETAKYYSKCRALIFPGLEDFGIVPLEAMASGRPVIAFRGGGALETVVEGKTGLFFDKQEPQALAQAIEKFNFMSFDKDRIRAHALQFDKPVFKQKIKAFVDEKYEEFKKRKK